jgi:hypothetical protein
MLEKKEYDFSKGKRGPLVPIPPGKTRITIRLDDEVLDWFRAQVHAAGGGDYQSLINSDCISVLPGGPISNRVTVYCGPGCHSCGQADRRC